jgi:ATP diphosphatase
MRAAKLQGRAKADLEPPSAEALKAELAQRFLDLSAEPEAAGEELGDALFAAVALARALDVDPERALRDANARFEGRFRADKHEGQDKEEGA